MPPRDSGRHGGAIAVALVLCLLAVTAAAQANPLTGAGSASSPGPWSLFVERILAEQASLQRRIALAIRSLKAGELGAPLWSLLSLSFLYGIVHAAGPGHGKAVVTSYLVASGAALRRGLTLSFVSAMAQGVVAVLLVGGLGLVFSASRAFANDFARWLELGSAALIVVFGLVLLWRAVAGGGHHHHHHHHDHGHGHGHDHDHHHGHEHHRHDAPRERRDFWSLAGLIGLRPCSGALLILFFTLGQGIFWAGVLAAFAIALGTAATVAALALLAVYGRRLALGVSGEGALGRLLHKALTFGGATAVSLFGLLLFMAAWQRASVF